MSKEKIRHIFGSHVITGEPIAIDRSQHQKRGSTETFLISIRKNKKNVIKNTKILLTSMTPYYKIVFF